MRVDPVTDVVTFLARPSYGEPIWLHYVYWLLAILSLSVAIAAWCAVPDQARPIHLFRFAVRFVIASFWWQQSLWGFPTDTSAVRYWTEREVLQSAYSIEGVLIKTLILPTFTPFADALYAFEIIVTLALFLGLYVRAVSALGAILMVSLFLGLYRAPLEWPWSDAFLIVLMLVMLADNYGRSLGLDAYREARSPAARLRRAAATAD